MAAKKGWFCRAFLWLFCPEVKRRSGPPQPKPKIRDPWELSEEQKKDTLNRHDAIAHTYKKLYGDKDD